MSLTQEELRRRRLAALGYETDGDSLPSVEGGQAEAGLSTASPEVDKGDLTAAWALLWPPTATEDDKRRWNKQGFTLRNDPNYGLQQGEGGPCGVLAAVQAEVVRTLIFDHDHDGEGGSTSSSRDSLGNQSTATEKRQGLGHLPIISNGQAEIALAKSMVSILARAALATVDGVDKASVSKCITLVTETEPSEGSAPLLLQKSFASSKEGKKEATLFLQSELAQFSREKGVVLFVLSLVLTRGAQRVKDDMDDMSYLTGQFGHCTQELLNLLLCGCAVSNVFDGSTMLGDSGLVLKGIPSRPPVGYLSHLEALRYLQVGSYYKSPLDPVWVIGSTSHFTIMFAVDRAVITETESEKLLEQVSRAFKAADTQEAGFIEVSQLGAVLATLMPELAQDEHGGRIGALASRLEMPGGTGIIVWSDFWMAVSRMMTGTTLEEVMAGDIATPSPILEPAGTSSQSVLPLMSVHEGSTPMQKGGRERSDSDVARELQAQFDSDAGTAVTPRQVPGSASTEDFRRPRSDSDVARDLQAQWATEETKTRGTPGPAPTEPASILPPGPASTPTLTAAAHINETISTPRGSLRNTIRRHDSIASEGDQKFDVYHYNGLTTGNRNGKGLVRFGLTRRAGQDAVGHSVSLGAGGTQATYACPIEEVIRTRWEGCRVDWYGQTPPSID